MGPTQNMSIEGSRYFVTFIDDYNRHTWACLLAKKSKVFTCFLKVMSLVERETGRKIKWLKSDVEKQYFSSQLSSFLLKEGIRREFSWRYIPDQNGVARRKNQTIEEAARAEVLMGRSGLDICLRTVRNGTKDRERISTRGGKYYED